MIESPIYEKIKYDPEAVSVYVTLLSLCPTTCDTVVVTPFELSKKMGCDINLVNRGLHVLMEKDIILIQRRVSGTLYVIRTPWNMDRTLQEMKPILHIEDVPTRYAYHNGDRVTIYTIDEDDYRRLFPDREVIPAYPVEDEPDVPSA